MLTKNAHGMNPAALIHMARMCSLLASVFNGLLFLLPTGQPVLLVEGAGHCLHSEAQSARNPGAGNPQEVCANDLSAEGVHAKTHNSDSMTLRAGVST